MKTSTLHIVPLPTEVAEEARRAVQSGVEDHTVVMVDSATGYPCRHCLRWAQAGERVILFPYASIPAGHPYTETGPIVVHVEPCERYVSRRGYATGSRDWRVFRAFTAS